MSLLQRALYETSALEPQENRMFNLSYFNEKRYINISDYYYLSPIDSPLSHDKRICWHRVFHASIFSDFVSHKKV